MLNDELERILMARRGIGTNAAMKSAEAPLDRIVGRIEMPKCDGAEVASGVFLIGEPRRNEDGKLVCLADANGALVLVELSIRVLPPNALAFSGARRASSAMRG